MGRTAASAGARALIEAGATALASWGMAGGLDPALVAGDILLPAEVMTPERVVLGTDRGWRERLGAAITTLAPVRSGRLVTTRQAVGSVREKSELFSSLGASAVDMESAPIAEAAQQRGLPFICVRVIVDSASDALPRAVTVAADREGHLHIWRLIGALARAPQELGPLLRLAQRYRAANRSLARIARTGSLAPRLLDSAS